LTNLNEQNNKINIVSEIDNPLAAPHISDNYLTWYDGTHINVYSIKDKIVVDKISTGTDIKITFPKVSNHLVTWHEDDNLFYKQIGSSDIQLLFSGKIFFHDVSDEYLVWQSGSDIFAYSFVFNERTKINSEEKGLLPYVRNNIVVYQVGAESEEAILKVVKLK